MSDTDAQRKRLSVNPTFWRYSNTDASPLGTDHKAVVLQKVAERNANTAAFQMLSRSITLGDCYKRARQLQHEGDFVAAAAELGQAKLLGADEKRLEQAYNTAAAVHLATMMHLLTVALAENAKRTAQKELAQTFFAPFVSAEAVSAEAKQAPAERQTFTAPTEAPPLASSDAGAAPPVRITEATEPCRPSHTQGTAGGGVEP
jgi:hypothetical protein